MIEGVIQTPLRVIDVPGGDVFHALKSNELGYKGFGEAYFSTVERGAVKAWKRHKEMTLNLIVPVGEIRFVMFDDRQGSSSYGRIQEVEASLKNYFRLTVPPMVWLGFQGLSRDLNLLLNIADIPHDPEESDRLGLEDIAFDWRIPA